MLAQLNNWKFIPKKKGHKKGKIHRMLLRSGQSCLQVVSLGH